MEQHQWTDTQQHNVCLRIYWEDATSELPLPKEKINVEISSKPMYVHVPEHQIDMDSLFSFIFSYTSFPHLMTIVVYLCVRGKEEEFLLRVSPAEIVKRKWSC